MSQEVWKMTLSKEFGWIFTSWLLVMLWKRRRDIIQFFTSLGWNLFSKVLMQQERFTFFIRNVIFLKSRLTRTTDFKSNLVPENLRYKVLLVVLLLREPELVVHIVIVKSFSYLSPKIFLPRFPWGVRGWVVGRHTKLKVSPL